MEQNFRIVYHHVGGRGGTAPFSAPKCFADELLTVMYDADADCVEHAKEKGRASMVLPYCVAGANGPLTFHITYDPYTSAIRPFNPRFGKYCDCKSSIDYVIEDASHVVETREVEGLTLASIVADKGVPSPDFLSVDTQGSDYDILLGSDHLIRSSVLGVYTEAGFDQANMDQKLFSDIHGLMLGNGFMLAELCQKHPISPCRLPIGARAGGVPLFADALYLRRLDQMPARPDAGAQAVDLYKLALFALTFDQLEYAYMAVKQARSLAADPKGGEVPLTVRFLNGIADAIDNVPQVFLPKFSDLLSAKASKARFLPSRLAQRRRLRQRLLVSPAEAWPDLKEYVRNQIDRRFGGVLYPLLNRYAADSALERHLADHGFLDLAHHVKTRRLQEERFLRWHRRS